MSRLCTKAELIGLDSNGKRIIKCVFICDTSSDLPAAFEYSAENKVLAMGSTAHIIYDNSDMELDSSGSWILSQPGTAAYTKSEIDSMLALKQDLLTWDAAPTSGSTNPVTSGGIFTAIAGFITMDDILGQGTPIISTSANPGDLNDYKIPGKYYGQNAVTNSLLHLPIANTNTHIGMYVIKITDSNIMQLVKFGGISYDKYLHWRRYAVGTDTWQAWYYIEAVQV